MNKNRFFILSLIICSFFTVSEIQAKTMHAILIADTVNNITEITKPDIAIVQRELKQAAYYTKLHLKEKYFYGRDFNPNKVMSYIQQLKIEPSDVIVFYFSGHGYRTQNKSTHWPNLNFEFNQPGLDFKILADAIKAKNARLSLIFADCCNNFVEQGFEPTPKAIDVNLPLKKINPQGYRRLFLEARGCIATCSSSPGEFSYGSHFGGLYTQCFLASLNHELANPNPNWKNIISKASSYVKHIQKPISEMSH